jgi:hypothetical protein
MILSSLSRLDSVRHGLVGTCLPLCLDILTVIAVVLGILVPCPSRVSITLLPNALS